MLGIDLAEQRKLKKIEVKCPWLGISVRSSPIDSEEPRRDGNPEAPGAEEGGGVLCLKAGEWVEVCKKD